MESQDDAVLYHRLGSHGQESSTPPSSLSLLYALRVLDTWAVRRGRSNTFSMKRSGSARRGRKMRTFFKAHINPEPIVTPQHFLCTYIYVWIIAHRQFYGLTAPRGNLSSKQWLHGKSAYHNLHSQYWVEVWLVKFCRDPLQRAHPKYDRHTCWGAQMQILS